VQGKILIIDGISTNRIVLKVKLTAAFYHVMQAGSMTEALDLIRIDKPDLVVTALNLPDGTAAELCNQLRSLHPGAAVPVLAIASCGNRAARINALRAGAFDVMDKPVNETLLLGRVRNMIRAHNKIAEWAFRDDTSCALGLAEAPAEFVRPGGISFIGLEAGPLQGWVRQVLPHLRARYCVTLLRDAMASMHSKAPPDALVLALPDTREHTEDYLRFISALRASAETRDIALLVIQSTPDPLRATSALDMGADDVMTGGFDAEELALRMQVLLRRKSQVARMLQSVRTGLREVVSDPLTCLYNRRYAMPYMARMIDQSARMRTPFAVILADMDHFKRINDEYGHASGDAVLEETARRLREAVRGTDMVARMGGEEFLIAMPDTDAATARHIANRLCTAIGGTPFKIPGARVPVSVTVSLGLALGSLAMQMDVRTHETVDSVIDRADKALYVAKIEGRNRVTQSQPQTRPAA
jgi:two-component system cell cycle response regulator